MKFKTGVYITVMILLVALTLPHQLAAQNPRYKLIDLGTLGGPASILAPSPTGGPENPTKALNNNGVVAGFSDIATPDPDCTYPISAVDCFFNHAFQWQDGVLKDIGTLQGADSHSYSAAQWMNDRGWIAGLSTTGGMDPFLFLPALHAVLWRNGQILDLGTLGEDFSQAFAVNNRGQVVGSSLNGQPDPFPFPIFPTPTQNRAFLWQSGVMQDLGTLCDPDGECGLDATAFGINESGQVAGISSTNVTPNATTSAPTTRPFLWENGKMIDLGTLGGTLSGVDGSAIVLNNRGQVAGTSTLAGDMTYHPFFWDHGVMTDMGTLGGDTGFVTWLNDAGEAVGTADLPGPSGGQGHHAFLWRKGVMTDLGSLGGNSHGEGINLQGQIVGRSVPTGSPVPHAFLWGNGGSMVDLNTLIPANSPILLEEGGNINDRGEIAGRGLPPGCLHVDVCGHAILLIPCDPAAGQDCSPVIANAMQNDGALSSKQTTSSSQQRLAHPQGPAAWRTQLARRYNLLGAATPKD